jgi:hypothetical protein
MWMTVWRPAVILFGVVSTLSAGLIAALPQPNVYSDALMYFVFFIMAVQAAMGVGALAAGVWGPITRWWEARSGRD